MVWTLRPDEVHQYQAEPPLDATAAPHRVDHQRLHGLVDKATTAVITHGDECRRQRGRQMVAGRSGSVRWTGPTLNLDSPRWSPKRSKSPTTASCRRSEESHMSQIALSKAEPPKEQSQSKVSSPARLKRFAQYMNRKRGRGTSPGNPLDNIKFQFNPKESPSASPQMGTHSDQRRQEGRSTAVQRLRTMQTHNGDLLRRDPQL